MENIWAIITKPDNIPIVCLMGLCCFSTSITFGQAFEIDRFDWAVKASKGK